MIVCQLDFDMMCFLSYPSCVELLYKDNNFYRKIVHAIFNFVLFLPDFGCRAAKFQALLNK